MQNHDNDDDDEIKSVHLWVSSLTLDRRETLRLYLNNAIDIPHNPFPHNPHVIFKNDSLICFWMEFELENNKDPLKLPSFFDNLKFEHFEYTVEEVSQQLHPLSNHR